MTTTTRPHVPKSSLRGLTLAALGIVFGDIGTSPLYAFREALHAEGGLTPDRGVVLGIASLALWALILVITVKYVSLVMRASAGGEGGLLVLVDLLGARPGRRGGALIALGLFGTALLYGDGAITPAISVLSAVEGLAVVTETLRPAVIPIAVVILVGLFAVQSRGTATLGRVFGPVMVVWFSTLAGLGLLAIVREPAVLQAINPVLAVRFLLDGGFPAFASLGAIFLVVTGGEALYADMGHFGRRPIAVAWFRLVFPALALNYLGQAALILADPTAVENPFYLLAPGWARIPLVLLATAATVIASQALISGLNSLSMQAVRMEYLPRLRVIHTSDTERGQIYIAALNWSLLLACVILVVTFRTSSNLAAAYGVAVTATMVITTILFGQVARVRFGWSPAVVWTMVGVFMVVDLGFLGANLLKLPGGGWLPLALGLVIWMFMVTWRSGRVLLRHETHDGQLSLEAFVAGLDDRDVARGEGTGVYLYSHAGKVPPALLATLRHVGSLPQRVVVLTVVLSEAAHVPPAARMKRTGLGKGFEAMSLTYGFRDPIDVPHALRATGGRLGAIDPDLADYFLGRDNVLPGGLVMRRWQERLFSVLLRFAADPVEVFQLPLDQVTTIGRTLRMDSRPSSR